MCRIIAVDCRVTVTNEEERKRKQRNSHRKHHSVVQRTIITTLSEKGQSTDTSFLSNAQCTDCMRFYKQVNSKNHSQG